MSARRAGGLRLDPRLSGNGTGRRPSLALVGGALALLVALALWWGLARGRSGAGGAEPASDAEAYRQAMAPLRASEEDAIAGLAGCTGERYSDDDAVIRALRERTLPAWDRVVTGLRAITPPAPVAPLHARFLAAAEAEVRALTRLAGALEQGDGVAVMLANVEHRTACEELDAVAEALTAALRPDAAAP